MNIQNLRVFIIERFFEDVHDVLELKMVIFAPNAVKPGCLSNIRAP
jgi:hypothetical protein